MRLVNESNSKVRERVTAVIKRLMIKASPAKVKTLFNTVLAMQETGSETKRRQIGLSRQLVLGIYCNSQGGQLKVPEGK